MHFSIGENIFTESYKIFKFEGGEMMRFLRNFLGCGTIEFKLKEIIKQLADNHCRKIPERTC